ncbi:hypothetical protein GCM10010532_110010 [Dactylosporangium siamense]|uniref:Uncharacterized protein n=1 Tax=Dactylosporangium siamense TaxID=685454 RepID=A0A919PYB7_9ACTN|nr:hypothetical protein Dsi01nite_106680 [Dactylosporangium siamense]
MDFINAPGQGGAAGLHFGGGRTSAVWNGRSRQGRDEGGMAAYRPGRTDGPARTDTTGRRSGGRAVDPYKEEIPRG